jgi:hypothetical protein
MVTKARKIHEILEQQPIDTVELKLDWTTKVYYNNVGNLLFRFDNAYFMFLEQRMSEDTFTPKNFTSVGDDQ